MNASVLMFAALNLLGVFISTISQVLLKKSAMARHDSIAREYLNIQVIVAYALFFAATLLSVLAYRGIPLSMGPILDVTGYLYITFFGVVLFGERLNAKKVLALNLIVVGIVVYSLGL